MKIKSQKGSITIFVLIALLFFTSFLLLMYAANTNKLVAIKEKSDILKGIYEKNTSDESINNIYNKKNTEQLIAGIEKVALPAEYQQVEYIESTGTQYIDTGVFAQTEKYKIIYDMEISEKVSGYIGANGILQIKVNSGIYYISRNSTSISTNSRRTVISEGEIKNGTITKLTIDDTTISESWNSSYYGKILLFALGDDQRVYNNTKLSDIKIYGCKIYENDILVRDFIPCKRKSDNKPGLFDLVENKFYTNQGDGEEDFTVGPDID